jgi:hypothetical protein
LKVALNTINQTNLYTPVYLKQVKQLIMTLFAVIIFLWIFHCKGPTI